MIRILFNSDLRNYKVIVRENFSEFKKEQFFDNLSNERDARSIFRRELEEIQKEHPKAEFFENKRLRIANIIDKSQDYSATISYTKENIISI